LNSLEMQWRGEITLFIDVVAGTKGIPVSNMT
jgi:hypothetical protein